MNRALREALQDADKALAYLRAMVAAKKRGAPRPKAPGKTKAERKAATKEETAKIREACIARANGIGELCGKPLDPEAAELCHLDGGIGRRIPEQRISNCVMEHHECHQGPTGFDRKPMAWFSAVQEWAWRHGYVVPDKYQRLFALKGTGT